MPTFKHGKRYERTNYFFRDILRTIPRLKPGVYQAFCRRCGIDKQDVWIAFSSRYVPNFEVRETGTYGFTPPIGNQVHLGKTFIDELEAALPWNGKPNRDSHAPSERESNLMLLLEVTVLHEMVHFFRRTFTEQGKMNGPGIEETIAQRFEMEAYGRFNTAKSLGLHSLSFAMATPSRHVSSQAVRSASCSVPKSS